MQTPVSSQGRYQRVRAISILNFKGGVGKTSLAINLSHELTRRGKVVVLVDCDRQRNATSIIPKDVPIGFTLREVLMGQAPLTQAIYEARSNLFVVPAHTDLEQAGKFITMSGPRTLKTLRNAVSRLEQDGVDFVLFEHEVAITGIVPSNLDYTKSMTTMYLQSLTKRFGQQVTKPIRTDAQISKSQSLHQSVFEYNSRSKGAQDYAAIAGLLLKD